MPTTKKTMSRSEATPKRSSSASRGASTSGKQSLSFYTTGENMTDMIRNSWVSDTPKHALKICREGLGMSTEQALEVITGKKKLTGDSRDGGLGWEDDNQTQISGIKLDVDTMLNRLESKWIDTSESINVFNGINVNDGTLEYEDDMSSLEYYKNKLADTLEQLQEVYLLVGKSLKNLPSHKVRSAQQIKKQYRKDNPEEFAQPTVIESRLSKIMNAKDEGSVLNILLGGIKKSRPEVKRPRSEVSSASGGVSTSGDTTRPFTTFNGNGTFYITHCNTQKCKAEGLDAGWLLPDGTFYAGDSMFIHKGILDELADRNFFKDKTYGSGEDAVQNEGNWIKFSGDTWYLFHKHKPTKQQVEYIIEYTTEVDEKTVIKINSYDLIHVTVFAKLLNGVKFDVWEMKYESEPIIDAEIYQRNNDKTNPLANFPTIDEVRDIDPMSTPFFQPDVAFVKWLIAYADGRMIIDCGAGSAYTTALINHLGGKCIAIEPHYTNEKNMFWKLKGFHFHVFVETAEESKIISQVPNGKALLLFARPCHSGFVYTTIKNNMPVGMEALYISHKGNEAEDLSDLKYTKLKHQGKSKSNEYVLSIKK